MLFVTEQDSVIFEKVAVSQLMTPLVALYGTRRFTVVFTKACNYAARLYYSKRIQFISLTLFLHMIYINVTLRFIPRLPR